jgi:Ca2+-binding RTX toxin-like protein
VVAATALAWACTPSAGLSLDPSSGVPGTRVSAKGRGFGHGPAEIHWNSADGPLLAVASGPDFSSTVTVPDGAAGVSYVVAVGHDEAGSVTGQAAAPFDLEAPSPEPIAATTVPPPAPTAYAPSAPAPGGVTSGNFVTAFNLSCFGRTVTVEGTPASEVIEGTRGRDVIAGLGGNDLIRGLGGNDLVCGGPGRDTLMGGRGNDRLAGGTGRDRLNGGIGRDTYVGGRGRDVASRCELSRSR